MSLCDCGARLAPIGLEAPAEFTMCAGCAAEAAGPAPSRAGRQNLAAGAAFGLLAASVAAGAWYSLVATTQYQISAIAVGVGWMVGRIVVLGARGQGPKLQALAVALTLLSMVAAEYLIGLHFYNEFFVAEGLERVSAVQPVGVMVSVVEDSLRADPMTLLFWLLAMAFAFRVAGVARSPQGGSLGGRATT